MARVNSNKPTPFDCHTQTVTRRLNGAHRQQRTFRMAYISSDIGLRGASREQTPGPSTRFDPLRTGPPSNRAAFEPGRLRSEPPSNRAAFYPGRLRTGPLSNRITRFKPGRPVRTGPPSNWAASEPGRLRTGPASKRAALFEPPRPFPSITGPARVQVRSGLFTAHGKQEASFHDTLTQRPHSVTRRQASGLTPYHAARRAEASRPRRHSEAARARLLVAPL